MKSYDERVMSVTDDVVNAVHDHLLEKFGADIWGRGYEEAAHQLFLAAETISLMITPKDLTYNDKGR